MKDHRNFFYGSHKVINLLLIHHRLTLDLWFAKDNRFLNPKSSYKRILMAPPCRLISLASSSYIWFYGMRDVGKNE